MAENKYHPIDINNWDRRDLYDHFSRLKLPHFAVAAYIDVTRLLEYKRHEGLSFYLSLIYLTTKVLNGIDNFRLRIIDGQVVSFDTIHTNFTHKRPEEEVFRFHTAPFEGVVYCSCTPNLDATALINPGMENPDDAIPRVNWGKYVERDGRWMINVTFTANHRFIDGYHVGLFFERLQAAINEL